MKLLGFALLAVTFLFWGCRGSLEGTEVNGDGSQIEFSVVLSSDNTDVLSRSIIFNGDQSGVSGVTGAQLLPTQDAAGNPTHFHVTAKDVYGKRYINDPLRNWDNTNGHNSLFATFNGIGDREGDTFLWPNDGLTFYAHFYKDGGSCLSTTDSVNFVYTLADKVSDQCDFLVADSIGRSASTVEDKGVPLKFRHTMAMLQFAFVKTTVADAEDVRLDSIAITDYVKGTIDVARPCAAGEQEMAIDTSGGVKTRVYAMPEVTGASAIKAQASTETKKYLKETSSLIFPDANDAVKMAEITYSTYSTATGAKLHTYKTKIELSPKTTTTARFKAGVMYQYTLQYNGKNLILVTQPKVYDWNSMYASIIVDVLDIWDDYGYIRDAYFVLTVGTSITIPKTIDASCKGTILLPSENESIEYNKANGNLVDVVIDDWPYAYLAGKYSSYYSYRSTLSTVEWYKVVYNSTKKRWEVYGYPNAYYLNGEWYMEFAAIYYLYKWKKKDEGKTKENKNTYTIQGKNNDRGGNFAVVTEPYQGSGEDTSPNYYPLIDDKTTYPVIVPESAWVAVSGGSNFWYFTSKAEWQSGVSANADMFNKFIIKELTSDLLSKFSNYNPATETIRWQKIAITSPYHLDGIVVDRE